MTRHKSTLVVLIIAPSIWYTSLNLKGWRVRNEISFMRYRFISPSVLPFWPTFSACDVAFVLPSLSTAKAPLCTVVALNGRWWNRGRWMTRVCEFFGKACGCVFLFVGSYVCVFTMIGWQRLIFLAGISMAKAALNDSIFKRSNPSGFARRKEDRLRLNPIGHNNKNKVVIV